MALEGITKPNQVASRLKAIAEQSGARVRFNAPNTTDLIASNGLGSPLDPSSVAKKLPWVEEGSRMGGCRDFDYNDIACGTQIYCDAFDAKPEAGKAGFFKTAQECFDAHEPAPKLPWMNAPPPKVRAESCQPYQISPECPITCGVIYHEQLCGTQAYCEAFDHKPRPSFLQGFKDSQACFDRHKPQNGSATFSQPPTATSKTPGTDTNGPVPNKSWDGPAPNKHWHGQPPSKSWDGPPSNKKWN